MNKIFKYSKKTVLLLLAMCLIVSITSCDNNESNEKSASPLLRVNEAFKYELINSGTSVWIKWKIQDGYYLYRDKIKFKINDAEIRQTDLPEGYIHEDEFFGIQQIYRDDVSFEIPYKDQKIIGDKISIEILSQGCADRGICYPPQRWKKTIEIDSNNFIEKNWISEYLKKPNLNVRYVNKFLGLLSLEIWYRLFITKEIKSDLKLG